MTDTYIRMLMLMWYILARQNEDCIGREECVFNLESYSVMLF